MQYVRDGYLSHTSNTITVFTPKLHHLDSMYYYDPTKMPYRPKISPLAVLKTHVMHICLKELLFTRYAAAQRSPPRVDER